MAQHKNWSELSDSDAGSHQDLLARIQDEFDKSLQAVKTGTLRLAQMKKAFKDARKIVHKQRLAAIHAAEKNLHKAKTEASAKAAAGRLEKAREAYHSGLKKIHATYKPGGGSYSY